MTEDEMFEKSFERPRNYFLRSNAEQWEIDKQLGILDWQGINLTQQQIQRCAEFYVE